MKWLDPRVRRLAMTLDQALRAPEPRDPAALRYTFERFGDVVTLTSEAGGYSATWKSGGPLTFSEGAPHEWRALADRVRKTNP
jgi:hypothetical protein